MISWPCVLKLKGDDELLYLDSAQTLNSECVDLIFSDDDYVFDSIGQCYLLSTNKLKLVLVTQDRVLSTDEVCHLIRDHEFNKASLCLAKIEFLSIETAINSLS